MMKTRNSLWRMDEGTNLTLKTNLKHVEAQLAAVKSGV